MKKVKRLAKPASLQGNTKKWTDELLNAVKNAKKTKTKVPERFYNKYKKEDILRALRNMYGDRNFSYCCYCESIIDDVSYEQIEHRIPKRKTIDKYPEKTYVWENLHLACAKCNGKKGKQYDEKYPILDPTVDDIETHLGYKLDPTNGVYRETLSKRGITTVEHADLDRNSLRIARRKIWHICWETIEEIRKLGDAPKAYTAKKMLRDQCEGEHGSLIQYLMDKYLV